MSKQDNIRNKALQLLEKTPNGLRFTDLRDSIENELKEKTNTINGSIWDLDATFPDLVYKPERGLFRHTKFRSNEITARETLATPKGANKIREFDFYKPFANWLEQEGLEDCTKAITLGGNKFGDKWGTPDVIGINKSRESDIIKHQHEIISAEIKTDNTQLITAFGQACAYRLFSNKIYIVIPKSAPDADIVRIDTLCRMYGIGLVLFNTDPENLVFEVRVRPVKFEPDMFYVNNYMKIVEKELFL